MQPKNESPREIHRTYRYELEKLRMLAAAAPDALTEPNAFDRFSDAVERLETLIDLYAYLLAHARR